MTQSNNDSGSDLLVGLNHVTVNYADIQIIDSVRFENESFQEAPIYFNNSLTCIIGGKSTGKSMLLRQMARAIDNDYALQQERRLPHNTFPSVKTTIGLK